MSKTATLTTAETQAIAHAARRVVGVSWDHLESATLKGMIAEAVADKHNDWLYVLLDLVDGVRYDLCNEDGDTIREATVLETVDSVMEEGGWIKVDGRICYVDLA